MRQKTAINVIGFIAQKADNLARAFFSRRLCTEEGMFIASRYLATVRRARSGMPMTSSSPRSARASIAAISALARFSALVSSVVYPTGVGMALMIADGLPWARGSWGVDVGTEWAGRLCLQTLEVTGCRSNRVRDAGGDQMSSAPKRQSSASKGRDIASDETSAVPRYQEFIRSEARLRSDQLTGLAELRRRILASRQDKSERITDNTLIRVAVDALLSQAHMVSGDTEDQIRDSVINTRRKKQS